MKIPLLVAEGENGGGAISTNRILRIIRVNDNKDLYRHPNYKVATVSIKPLNDPKLPDYKWAGYGHDSELVARFKTQYEAAEWEAFIKGDIAVKREDLLITLKKAA